MVQKSTNKLTKHELDFAGNSDYPATKHKVISKICLLMNEIALSLREYLPENQFITVKNSKVTKGEQYKTMPYVVLDYPQIKGPGFDAVCRTMFWWGNYFSCSLIIRTALIDIPRTADHLLTLKKTKLLTGSNLWEQELAAPGFKKIRLLAKKDLVAYLQENEYLKLSCKINLKHHTDMPVKALKIYSTWLAGIKKGAD